MTDFDDLLREAMRGHTEHLTLRPTAAHDALRAAARNTRLQTLAGTGGAVAVASAIVVGAVSVVGGTHHASATLGASPVSTLPSPSGGPGACRSKTSVSYGAHPLQGTPGAPAALNNVSLPNPAPGFPLRRMPDQAASRTSFGSTTLWTQTFLVGKTADTVTCLAGGGEEGTPTGPEATVLVVYGDLAPADTLDKVVGSRTVHGEQADVTTNSDHEPGLNFHTGPFTVLIYGFTGATVDSLVMLGNALQGLG